MLCDICKKNDATIRIQQVNNGTAQTVNICNECAEKHQMMPRVDFDDVNIGEVLQNIKKITKNLNLKDIIITDSNSLPKPSVLVCPKCNWSLEKIDQNGGLLGCDECYKTFEDIVMETIENIHRCKIHTGKHPVHFEPDNDLILDEKIIKLEADLQEAIKLEKYEHAALLRDEINLLKKKKAKQNG